MHSQYSHCSPSCFTYSALSFVWYLFFFVGEHLAEKMSREFYLFPRALEETEFHCSLTVSPFCRVFSLLTKRVMSVLSRQCFPGDRRDGGGECDLHFKNVFLFSSFLFEEEKGVEHVVSVVGLLLLSNIVLWILSLLVSFFVFFLLSSFLTSPGAASCCVIWSFIFIRVRLCMFLLQAVSVDASL